MKDKFDSYWNSSEFDNLYRNEIAPILRKHEKYRKSTVARLISMFVLSVILFLIAFSIFPLIIYFNITDNVLVAMLLSSIFLFVLLGIIAILNVNELKKGYIVALKSECFSDILKFFGDVSWSHNAGVISAEELDASGLFADYNKRVTDDEFEGTYKGVNYRICETNLLLEQKYGRYSGCTSIFKGVVFSFDLNKTLKHRTIVSSKWDLTQENTQVLYLFPFLYPIFCAVILYLGTRFLWLAFVVAFCLVALVCFLKKKAKEKDLHKVPLESTDFTKKFNVFSSDPIEARCMVTHVFMEKFQNLKTAFGSSKVKCAFYDNKIMIAIHTNKNLFEIGETFKKLENPETIHTFYKELSSINEIIDYFELYEQEVS